MSRRKKVSIALELTEVMHALAGARILVSTVLLGGLPQGPDDQETPAAVEAILRLVGLRLRDSVSAIRGTVDPVLLWAPHNAALPRSSEEGARDLHLTAVVAPDASQRPSGRRNSKSRQPSAAIERRRTGRRTRPPTARRAPQRGAPGSRTSGSTGPPRSSASG